MHKTQLIKRGGLPPLKLQQGGSLAKNFGSLFAGMSGNYNPFSTLNQDGTEMTEGQLLNQKIGGSAGALFNGFMGLANLKASGMNKDQRQIGMGDLAVDTAAGVANAFGPVGAAIGTSLGIVNKFGGMLLGTPKALKDFKVNDTVNSSSAYAGIADSSNEVAKNAETYKNAGLFGKLFGGKNKLIDQTKMANVQQGQITKLIGDNQIAKNRIGNSGLLDTNKNKLYNSGMWNNGSVMFGQDGGTLNKSGSAPTRTYEEYKSLLGTTAAKIDFKKLRDLKNKLVVQVKQHAEGGVIEPVNVIAVGKLHAHKHSLKELEHLEDADITLKGIPVVSIGEDGGVIQHAEVEVDELILHYDLTKRMEALYEEGTEEAMIQAGRILAREIVKNTRDSKSKILKQT